MSYWLYLKNDDDGWTEQREAPWSNYTSNMTYAIAHGGVAMTAYRSETMPELFRLDGAKADVAARALRACVMKIRADAIMLRKREPPSGWGSVNGVCDWLSSFATFCEESPTATVVVSG